MSENMRLEGRELRRRRGEFLADTVTMADLTGRHSDLEAYELLVADVARDISSILARIDRIEARLEERRLARLQLAKLHLERSLLQAQIDALRANPFRGAIVGC